MTEREKQNEEMKQGLRDLAMDFHRNIERFCRFIDDAEALIKFHERNTMAMAEHMDKELIQ